MTVRAWHRIWAAYDRIDRQLTETRARIGIPALRISLGIVFLWFGALRLFPELSPAEDLAADTIEVLIKNTVLVAVALVVGATVRGGDLTPDPPDAPAL